MTEKLKEESNKNCYENGCDNSDHHSKKNRGHNHLKNKFKNRVLKNKGSLPSKKNPMITKTNTSLNQSNKNECKSESKEMKDYTMKQMKKIENNMNEIINDEKNEMKNEIKEEIHFEIIYEGELHLVNDFHEQFNDTFRFQSMRKDLNETFEMTTSEMNKIQITNENQ